MVNFYRENENGFYIEAPGSINQNRIKNDLIWDINRCLNQRYCLYEFFPRKDYFNSFSKLCRSTSVYEPKWKCIFKPKWKCILEPLDDMFIDPREMSKEEVESFRQILDPKRKIQSDVFYESLCMENVDLDYIAIKKCDVDAYIEPEFKSKVSLYRWMESSAPISVSLFSAKEVQIFINEMDLFEAVKEIVFKHCQSWNDL